MVTLHNTGTNRVGCHILGISLEVTTVVGHTNLMNEERDDDDDDDDDQHGMKDERKWVVNLK